MRREEEEEERCLTYGNFVSLIVVVVIADGDGVHILRSDDWSRLGRIGYAQ